MQKGKKKCFYTATDVSKLPPWVMDHVASFQWAVTSLNGGHKNCPTSLKLGGKMKYNTKRNTNLHWASPLSTWISPFLTWLSLLEFVLQSKTKTKLSKKFTSSEYKVQARIQYLVPIGISYTHIEYHPLHRASMPPLDMGLGGQVVWVPVYIILGPNATRPKGQKVLQSSRFNPLDPLGLVHLQPKPINRLPSPKVKGSTNPLFSPAYYTNTSPYHILRDH